MDLLGQARKDLGVTEISKGIGLHKSTVCRLLSTLATKGYIEQDSGTGKYRLGLKLCELGNVRLGQIEVRAQARPFLEELVDASLEVAHLAILDHGEVIYIDKVEASQTLTMQSRIGSRVQAHCTALGKVLLAFRRDEEVETIVAGKGLPRFTANTITSSDRLSAHLAKVRAQGFAIDDEEHEKGIRCLAVPVRDHTGEVVAAMSVSGPTVRLSREKASKLVPVVLGIGERVSKALGCGW